MSAGDAPRLARPERLYGLPHAEYLYGDPAEVWETEIDGQYDEDETAWTIEEWTATTAADRIVGGLSIVEGVMEYLCEEMVESGDAWTDVVGDAEVIAAADALSALIASKVTYRWAEKKVADHTITLDGEGKPLLNGEPMYVRRDR